MGFIINFSTSIREKICCLEQNLLVGVFFPNIKQSQIQVFGASHHVSSHGTHIFQRWVPSIISPTDPLLPWWGPLCWDAPCRSPPPKKKVRIMPNKHPLCKVYIQHMGLIMMENAKKIATFLYMQHTQHREIVFLPFQIMRWCCMAMLNPVAIPQ